MIVMVGFMGAGKTTIGRNVARALGLHFTDADHAIEAQARRPIRQIFADEGEPAFRKLEREVISRLLGRADEAVLALGGGAVENPDVRAALAGHEVVFLQITLDDALARVGYDTGRPMLRAPDLGDIYQRRQAGYAQVAAITVRVGGGRSADEVSREVVGRLRPGRG